MLEAYNALVAERATLGIPALPLTKDQTAELVKLLKTPAKGTESELLELITNRVPAGVDEAAAEVELLLDDEDDDAAAAVVVFFPEANLFCNANAGAGLANS